MQSGTDGDNFTVGGNLTVTGTATGTTASVSDDSTKFATTAFVRDIIPSGVIVMWSGSVATIPSGWLICDGSNSTPDLRNRFIVGAGSTYSVAGTGGSADAIVVSHTHTGSTSTASLTGTLRNVEEPFGSASGIVSLSDQGQAFYGGTGSTAYNRQANFNASHSHTFTTDSSGSSGTNANLPPYYALAYIMKA
jgi:hypothetical protein